MKHTSRSPLLNSTIAFVLAGMLVTTIHEVSHLIMSLALGHSTIIYPFFVNSLGHVSDWHQILIAGTGPLFSLFSGLIIIWWMKNWLKGSANSFVKLLVLWFGFLSAETGFGYFFIAPLVSGGDTGQVLALLHASWLVYAIVFAIGIAGFLLLLPRLLATRLSGFAHDKSSFFQLSMYPWLIGTGILIIISCLSILMMTINHIDNPGLIGLMGIATIGVFVPMADYKKPTNGALKEPAFTFPKIGIGMTALVALFLVIILARGVSF